ncbi:MAG: site-2 protease family protein [Candidatus Melainabacteria bacterium]|nr:site-2 protease family protein [Candidatus Melainabacteria bacterium]
MLVQVFAVFVMLAILSTLIIVHECGHFSVARFFGFQTPVFGFGLPFGPHWVVGKKWGTEFRIHACLLGGYVAIPELGDESAASEDAFGVPLKPFKKFPIWQRALVAFAGVGFNIIFAYLVMLVMFLSLGQQSQPTVVTKLIPADSIAAKAGIKVNDTIVAINDKPVASTDDTVAALSSHRSELVHIQILRDSKPMTIDVTTSEKGKVGMQLEGKGPATYKKVEGNFFDVARQALVRLYTLTASMMSALGQMVEGLVGGGGEKAGAGHPKVSIGDLHGVLAVVKIGADIAQQDWSQLFLFTILISMDLAIINLLPWPALDGGHLAFMTFEAVRGRPMGERAQGEIVKWGFVSLIVLMVVIMVNDVRALVTGQLDYKKDKQQEDKADKSDKADKKPLTDSTEKASDKAAGDAEKAAVDTSSSEKKEEPPTPPDASKSNAESSNKAPDAEKPPEATKSDATSSDKTPAEPSH